jgi:hypothetical protein
MKDEIGETCSTQERDAKCVKILIVITVVSLYFEDTSVFAERYCEFVRWWGVINRQQKGYTKQYFIENKTNAGRNTQAYSRLPKGVAAVTHCSAISGLACLTLRSQLCVRTIGSLCDNHMGEEAKEFV